MGRRQCATADGPCYRCLYPEPPPPGMVQNYAEGGVFGVLPGLVGTIQAIETLKLILGRGESLAGRLLMIDALSMQFRSVIVERDPKCPACGVRTITQLIDYDEFCGTPALGAVMESVRQITPQELALRRARGDDVDLIDVREPHETETGIVPGATLIPLGDFASAIATLDTSRVFVLMCRSGKRSADAARQLQAAGFKNVTSLAGGMIRWSEESREIAKSP